MAETGADVEVRELAAKTASEIRRRGWIQGFYVPPDVKNLRGSARTAAAQDCPVCILGGVLAVVHGSPVRGYETVHSIPLVKELDRRTSTSAADWNDEPGRTQDEVLALLDSIAAGQ